MSEEKVNREGLEQLKRVLREVDARGATLVMEGFIQGKDEEDKWNYDVDLTKNDLPEQIEFKCGFAACAIGWAGFDPYFQRAGLYIGPNDRGAITLEWKGQDGDYCADIINGSRDTSG